MITLLYRGSDIDLHIIPFETLIGIVIVLGGIYLVFRWLNGGPLFPKDEN